MLTNQRTSLTILSTVIIFTLSFSTSFASDVVFRLLIMLTQRLETGLKTMPHSVTVLAILRL